MSIQQWSDNIILLEAQNDPVFMDDIDSVLAMVTEKPTQHVVIDFKSISAINSSNISGLLKLRTQVVNNPLLHVIDRHGLLVASFSQLVEGGDRRVSLIHTSR